MIVSLPGEHKHTHETFVEWRGEMQFNLLIKNQLCAFFCCLRKKGKQPTQQTTKQFRFSSVLYYFIGPPRLCNNQKICDDVQTQNQKKKRNKQMRTHEVKRERTQGRTHIQQASTCAGLIFNKKTAVVSMCVLTGIF
jgi:hypothetical protein